ncbi:MAG: alanine--tRNA ligase [Candidatus Pacearchaeota archaeon]|nr:alanine--tRNA ligase [Candidatus Pacearchaeota archaeon]
MDRKGLIKKYIDFFKLKNHKEIPNFPLVPENDPTVLFTTAGMHPIVPFLLGQPHPLGKRLVNVQRCIRTGDIDKVGNEVHHTFFEMLGNWSLGDYFKKEAIEYSFEFLTKVLKIPKEKLAVSCFLGDETAEKDEEAASIWMKLGVAKERIAFLSKENNWWGPAGNTGPCGPDTEMFYWRSKSSPPKTFNPKDNNWVEIWNNVLMQYNKDSFGKYNSAKQKNVDTGMGVERTIAVLDGLTDNYLTSSFFPIIKEIEKISGKKYSKIEGETRAMRIIADHIKASVMILAEKVSPSNIERGYVLRRLIRIAIRYGKFLGMKDFTKSLVTPILKIYDNYPLLQKNKEFIIQELELEEKRFNETIELGIRYFEKIKSQSRREITGKDAFLLYQSYGFPIEMTQELAKDSKIEVDILGYKKELAKHQELSRTASSGQFKSGLADNSEQVTKYHTATHLLHAALRQVLGTEVEQRGSNITAERLRFDFSYPQKLTACQLQEVENLVNEYIKSGLDVKRDELTLEQAKKSGALGLFEHKYGEKVSVYTVCGKDKISKEICSGPHVTNTKELGHFKIIKEEASSAGVRRIKAELIDETK